VPAIGGGRVGRELGGRGVVVEERVSPAAGLRKSLAVLLDDEGLLNGWPRSKTWRQLFDRTQTCVRLKEAELSETSSLPQAFFGAGVKDLELP